MLTVTLLKMKKRLTVRKSMDNSLGEYFQYIYFNKLVTVCYDSETFW